MVTVVISGLVVVSSVVASGCSVVLTSVSVVELAMLLTSVTLVQLQPVGMVAVTISEVISVEPSTLPSIVGVVVNSCGGDVLKTVVVYSPDGKVEDVNVEVSTISVVTSVTSVVSLVVEEPFEVPAVDVEPGLVVGDMMGEGKHITSTAS